MLYNKKSVQKLIEVVSLDDLEVIKGCIIDFMEYLEIAAVVNIKIQSAWKSGIRGEEFRDIVKRLDNEITYKHNSAIISTKVLNRLSKRYDTPLVYLGDEEDEVEMGDFMGEVITCLGKENIEILATK